MAAFGCLPGFPYRRGVVQQSALDQNLQPPSGDPADPARPGAVCGPCALLEHGQCIVPPSGKLVDHPGDAEMVWPEPSSARLFLATRLLREFLRGNGSVAVQREPRCPYRCGDPVTPDRRPTRHSRLLRLDDHLESLDTP